MWNALAGRPPDGAPAPDASDVTDAGMSISRQCQNPDPVGASGSWQVTAKLLVSAGNPDQDSCGEMFSPVMPKLLYTCLSLICTPSLTSSLVTVNDVTAGRKSYGSGARSAMLTTSLYPVQRYRCRRPPATEGVQAPD